MSQSSVTESEGSEDVLISTFAGDACSNRSRSNDGEHMTFKELTFDLAECFTSFEQNRLTFRTWFSSVDDIFIIEFMKLLSAFVATVSEGDLAVPDEAHYRICLMSIWNVHFLSDLLCLRDLASVEKLQSEKDAQAYQQHSISRQCSLVLGSLEKMIISLVAIQIPKELPPSLRERQKEDIILVAGQLPDHTFEFPEVLLSRQSSPAVKRLILSILFGLFVVESTQEHGAHLDYDLPHLLDCLQQLICDTDPSAPRNILAQDDDGTRTMYAMTWALYSTVQCSIDLRGHASPIQPHTSSVLQSMLKRVLIRDNSVNEETPFYIHSPDTAQLIVMCWGDCIAFAWSRWKDSCTPGFDPIVCLTSNWLCQVGEGHPLEVKALPTLFDQTITFNLSASVAALTKQLDYLAKHDFQSEDSEMRLIHIYRCTQFIKSMRESDGAALESVAMTQNLLVILLSLGESEENLPVRSVKGEILDLLCSLKKIDLCRAIDACPGSLKKQVEVKLGEKIGTALRNLRSCNSPKSGETRRLSPHSLVELLALLNLICVLCSAGSKICLTASAVSLLSTVLKIIEKRTLPLTCSVYAADLRAAMLSCLTVFEPLHRKSGGVAGSLSTRRTVKKLWDSGSVFALALNADSWPHLSLSSAFATYVMSNSGPLAKDRLLCVEVWNHLRDTLLLSLPLAHGTTPPRATTANDCLKNVCKGLRHILKQADDSAGDVSRCLSLVGTSVNSKYAHAFSPDGPFLPLMGSVAQYIRASPVLVNLSGVLSSAVRRREEESEDPAYYELAMACEELLMVLNKNNSRDTIP